MKSLFTGFASLVCCWRRFPTPSSRLLFPELTKPARSERTNNQGCYTIPYLLPGTYSVEASAVGFAALKRENIVLQTADKLNLPLRLQVGCPAHARTERMVSARRVAVNGF